jgi:hypothetical protein
MWIRMSNSVARVLGLIARLIPVGLLAITGCATFRPINLPGPVLPSPPSEKLRAEWKTIAVSGGLSTPTMTSRNTSGKGEGAIAAAGNSVFYTTAALGLGGGYGIALGIMISPATALIGAVVGSIKAESAETVEEHRAALNRAFASINWQSLMCEPTIATGRQHTRLNFVVVNDSTGESAQVTATTAQAILEVQVADLALISAAAADPDLQFIMAVSTKIKRPGSSQVLYENRLFYEGPAHRFTEWTADEARLWREQVELARQRLADRVIHEVFLLYHMEESEQ